MFKLTDMDLRNFAEEVDLEAKRVAGRNGRGELPRSFFETYSAMANTNGGIILLGIEEKPKGIFTAIGIPEPEPVLKALWDGLNNRKQVSINLLANQMVEVLDYQGKNVIQVSVPRARRDQRPVYKGTNPFEGTYRRRVQLPVSLKPEQTGKGSGYSSEPLQESSVPLEESSDHLERLEGIALPVRVRGRVPTDVML